MKGIDVSHYNIVTDYVKAANGQDFVYIKATEGTNYVDPKMKAHAAGFGPTGVKTGYYHFASLNSASIATDARTEASFFVNTIKGLPVGMPLVLDIEENKANLKPTQVLEWITNFMDEMSKLGHTDNVLYSYTPFLNANLPANHGLKYPLWIAAYTNKKQPALPKGWDKYWLWQYSNKGAVPGIKGDVDLNSSL